MQPIITLDHVTAGYDGRPQLFDASLSIAPGDYVGVVGPNGGGKTTLMRVILGLLKPMSGSIHYYNKEGIEQRSLHMGYLPQYSSIDRDFPISVRETILTGLNGDKPIWRGYSKEQRQEAERLISRMQLDELASRPIKALSGGELQRVLLARAVVARPCVLILDEPNTYIDAPSQQLMQQMLASINKAGCAIVMVSHDTEQVHAVARTIVTVDEHISVKSHTPHHVCQCPTSRPTS